VVELWKAEDHRIAVRGTLAEIVEILNETADATSARLRPRRAMRPVRKRWR